MGRVSEVAVAGYSDGNGYNGERVPVDPTHPLPVAVYSGGSAVAGLTAADLRSQNTAFASVNSGTSSVTLLAASTTRNGATIVNTDANVLYIDVTGGTAAATRYAYQLATGQSVEIPFGITGAITGVWGADGSGAALVSSAAP